MYDQTCCCLANYGSQLIKKSAYIWTLSKRLDLPPVFLGTAKAIFFLTNKTAQKMAIMSKFKHNCASKVFGLESKPVKTGLDE